MTSRACAAMQSCLTTIAPTAKPKCYAKGQLHTHFDTLLLIWAAQSTPLHAHHLLNIGQSCVLLWNWSRYSIFLASRPHLPACFIAGLWFGDDRLQDWSVTNSPWLVE